MPDEKAISLDNLQTFKNNCDTAYEPRKNIPTPTTANNGQVLGVTNGVYAFVKISTPTSLVKRYQHNIKCYQSGIVFISFSFINDVSTPYTGAINLINAISALGFSDNTHMLPANGMFRQGTSQNIIYGIVALPSVTSVNVHTLHYDSVANSVSESSYPLTSSGLPYVNDTVVDLGS